MINKRGFTLVELLAVIVILGIILLIAVPKVTATISNATDASMAASAKMIAASAEREFAVRQSLSYNDYSTGNVIMLSNVHFMLQQMIPTTTILCTDIVNLSANDYVLTVDGCNASVVDETGVATVTLVGAEGGRFEGKYVCNGTRLSATVTTEPCF